MTSTGFEPTLEGQATSPMPGGFQDDLASFANENPGSQAGYTNTSKGRPEQGENAAPKQRSHWEPRTCRICLETVNPTFHPPSENVSGIFQPSPSVTYDSPDPEAGRLLRPCKCKGSSKFVHEGCLQAWRHADPGYGKRNYWQCPTCGFRYRLERMQWGRWISSTATQISLTISIFFISLFILGFVADPIINLYLDPLSVVSSAPLSKINTRIEPILSDDEVPSWTEHFLKGIASLGLLGFVKMILALSPWQWWNLRTTGILRGSGQSSNTGRDRLANISWLVVIIGIGTFLWAVYQGVRAWCRRTLEKAGERVMDVGNDDNDMQEEDTGLHGVPSS